MKISELKDWRKYKHPLLGIVTVHDIWEWNVAITIEKTWVSKTVWEIVAKYFIPLTFTDEDE